VKYTAALHQQKEKSAYLQAVLEALNIVFPLHAKSAEKNVYGVSLLGQVSP
jgi:hypothetical protein